MRRRDVIGEYTDGRWRDGLAWSHIDRETGILRKLISKTALTSEAVAVHAIADYPDLMALLMCTPPEERVGPLVVTNRGVPPTEAQCRRFFRMIARKAGIPDKVWNMDARAGAVTEAYESGATEEEAMALATHSERDTSRRYLRELTEQSRRAAAKRVASRKE